MKIKALLFFELARPFTLIFPFVASFAGLMLASERADLKSAFLGISVGFILIIVHSAANIFNQYFDRDIDAVNKPTRPVPQGRITPVAVLAISIVTYTVGIGLSLLVNFRFFALVFLYAALTVIYSAPPRLKRFPWLSNVTIAIARGMLILMAGYAAAGPLDVEIWAISSVLGIYLVGAASTKDFAEIEGDRKHGINTLPVIYGTEKTIRIIWPFFIFPFLLIPAYCYLSLIPFKMILLTAFVLPGVFTVSSMLKNPSEKAFTENSLSWALMYLTIIFFPIAAMILEFT
ncbi:MAG: UbiA family prenyltransferase [bacterium]